MAFSFDSAWLVPKKGTMDELRFALRPTACLQPVAARKIRLASTVWHSISSSCKGSSKIHWQKQKYLPRRHSSGFANHQEIGGISAFDKARQIAVRKFLAVSEDHQEPKILAKTGAQTHCARVPAIQIPQTQFGLEGRLPARDYQACCSFIDSGRHPVCHQLHQHMEMLYL